MPMGMDLVGTESQRANVTKDPAGIAFATRAIAVVHVHDSDAAKARNLTLRQICDADGYLKDHADSLTMSLFRAFGRNCLPVLESYLEGTQSAQDLEVLIRKYEHGLEGAVGL